MVQPGDLFNSVGRDTAIGRARSSAKDVARALKSAAAVVMSASSGIGLRSAGTFARRSAIPALRPRTSPASGVGGSSVRLRFLIMLAVAVASRAMTFGNPIVYTDEEFYFAAARAITNGALPFVDIWDRKPIGLFLAYLLPASLPWPLGIWLYQLMALLCAIATAWLVARLADGAGWRGGATLAGVAYIVWITLAGGQGGQSPVLYNPLMALAALLIVEPSGGARRWRAATAMLLVGAALQIKYTVVVEGIFFGLWLMYLEWRNTSKIKTALSWGAVLAGIALLPTAIAAGFYQYLGELDAFVFANFSSVFARNPDPVAVELTNVAKSAVILLPLVAMAVSSRGTSVEGNALSRAFLFGWLGAALLSFALIRPWSVHYTLPVMLPAAILAAGFLGRADRRKLAIAGICTAAIAGQALLAFSRVQRGTPAEFEAIAKAIGSGPGCLYVYSSSSMLYPATGRCALSRYVFPSHLTRAREAGAVGVEQSTELRRIFQAAPAVVVMSLPYKGERMDIRATALSQLEQHYRLAEQLPLGRKQVSIYVRRAAGIPQTAVSRFE